MKNQDNNTLKETNDLLNLKEIVEKAEKFDEIETFTLNNGQDMQFYPYFSRSKVKEIIDEYKTYMMSEDKDDKSFMEMVNKDELSIVLFWYFLTIKKFTHFGESMKRIKKVKSLAPYYNALLETGLLEEIVNDVFIYDELKKINDMFAREAAVSASAMEFVEKFDSELNKSRDKFEKAYIDKK
ncbi:hypothetical protein QOK74_08515 [Staphylococcus saprophyticus]|uniref:hypothetical protein n=1 Tax=Staphylococcus saprophyticus TaxID=29385 RepID=UPI0024C3BC0F|nr:hypothetical protein [Staphylococcus saprophyticus]MDK1672915.1 hypothetical protein [Staphylococcus saprophyticus]